ncbi:MAG: helix-turn-helix domain-containing protein [Proteobacteria bacterium]|nr:helix-turn-helix domain-containing protein [Pseudomonadota bacterium]
MPNDTAQAVLAASLEEPGGRPLPEHPDALLYTAEAAFLLGLSPRTLESLRLKGGGPAYYSVGRRACRYRRCDLNTWLDARRRKSTSDPGPSEPEAAS